jgi:hypothetical protein
MIFEVNKEATKYNDQAKAVLSHGNNIAQTLKELYFSARDSVFGIEGYTVADAQKLLDAMEVLSPGSVIKCFQLHAAFGEFLKATNPAAVTDADLVSPVAYEIEMTESGPRIKLVGDKYPTEVSNEG